jgi:hypothetical protein
MPAARLNRKVKNRLRVLSSNYCSNRSCLPPTTFRLSDYERRRQIPGSPPHLASARPLDSSCFTIRSDLCPPCPLCCCDLATSRCRHGSFGRHRNRNNSLSLDFSPPCFLSGCYAGAPFGRNFAARTGSVAGSVDSSKGLKCRIQS